MATWGQLQKSAIDFHVKMSNFTAEINMFTAWFWNILGLVSCFFPWGHWERVIFLFFFFYYIQFYFSVTFSSETFIYLGFIYNLH